MVARGRTCERSLNILFVINDLYTRGNGLAASARRTIALLRERGHRVRILSAPPRDGDDCGVGMPEYPLPPMSVPVVGSLIASQGYAFARVRRAQVKRALQWADVVHLEEPFYLQAVVAQLARRAGVPALATYHIHPENLTASIYLDRARLLNRMILELWKRAIFNRCSLVQCPSQSVWDRLELLALRPPLLLLSNGVPLGGSMARIRVAMKVTRLLFVSSPSGVSLGKKTRRPFCVPCATAPMRALLNWPLPGAARPSVLCAPRPRLS